MKQKAKLWLIVAGLISLMSCNKLEGKTDSDLGTFAKGANISWLPQMEKSGYIFWFFVTLGASKQFQMLIQSRLYMHF